jgi:hypothetical protein
MTTITLHREHKIENGGRPRTSMQGTRMFKFEWDNQKAQSNLLKHGVSFDEAVSVFGASQQRSHHQRKKGNPV